MEQNTYLLILLITCWTLNPFLKKKVASKLDSNEHLIFNHALCSMIIIMYLIYLLMNNKYNWRNLKSLDANDVIVSSSGAFTTVLASMLLIKLLKDGEITYILPHAQPCILVLTLFIGIFFYGESFTPNKIIGTLLIVGGLVFMNM
jgi:uncharacterized membrane protein